MSKVLGEIRAEKLLLEKCNDNKKVYAALQLGYLSIGKKLKKQEICSKIVQKKSFFKFAPKCWSTVNYFVLQLALGLCKSALVYG